MLFVAAMPKQSYFRLLWRGKQLSKWSNSLQKDGGCQLCPRAVCLTCRYWRHGVVSWPVEADGEKSGCRSPKAGTTNHLGLVQQRDEKWVSEQ